MDTALQHHSPWLMIILVTVINTSAIIVTFNVTPSFPHYTVFMQLSVHYHMVITCYRSMLPDVIEESEIPYGVRREELFYAYFVFFTKFGAGITLGISTVILA